jgi:hypothetical protein
MISQALRLGAQKKAHTKSSSMCLFETIFLCGYLTKVIVPEYSYSFPSKAITLAIYM